MKRVPKDSRSYFELLKDPRWQRKRLDIFERDMWRCTVCETTTETLQVHHKVYRKGLKPWESPDDDLTTVCEACHKVYTRQQERLKNLVALLDFRDMELVIGWATAMHAYAADEPSIYVEGPDDAAGVASFFGITFSEVMNADQGGLLLTRDLEKLMRRGK